MVKDNWVKKKFYFNKYFDYVQPIEDQDRVKIVFIKDVLNGYEIYDYRDSNDRSVIDFIKRKTEMYIHFRYKQRLWIANTR